MALVSTAVVGVDTAVLYDSGWKMVNGTGATQTLETLTYPKDSIIHVYGRRWGNATTGSEWYLSIPYGTGSFSYAYWRTLNTKEAAPINTALNSQYEYKLDANQVAYPVTQSAVRDNAQGMSLAAGVTAYFKSSSAAIASDGMQYRIIVENSTSAVMLAR